MHDFATRRTMMVDTQVRPNDVTKYPLIAAMLEVPREVFVPTALRQAAYLGENLDIAQGRVLLEPRSFAKLLDALDVQPTDLVLDIGCGLGYSTAVIARLAEAVVAIEEGPLAAQAQDALAAEGADNAAVVAGPLAAGAPQHGPYDAIMIEGAIEVLPADIADQLKDGGRIGALFMEGALGVARIGVKIDGAISWRNAFHAAAPVLPGFAAKHAFTL
ncbi:protein-L-isoaspartate O-methyltransferase [Rhodobacter veldkampii DSM 11550]|uniref:Protein-L-isoaspartate O-methyltransferase n=1 Tax=Phaeovulum veldkampii DSM 11550 TaxID=1185920 RepID=A0A2T4JBG2_9RHOB|nr:protein-L-isoaspartate O-methyltransferase [Phaeovulum veldkampii]MBK5946703.1 protein-L-isoaspartate O-methyltransferase [Phaeovulum veldkampii DSM 11550]NCU20415.1 protein-L-isoaspartate O-methyltransferase [Candidatus Falkowbacteria bacterium]PTE15193.1 protein-L-isoaspartate O-methyltransferase [Phaeovulum veldkampii DSM 11550]TDQ59244.1 protein-L-isoaspartate(D-aspartate) O-methyltransferase [Phaeovulum veldkampii DSM 11550]